MGELDLTELMGRLKIVRLQRMAGVYFLFDAAGAIAYIGQSVHVESRVLSHRTEGRIKFKTAKYIPVTNAQKRLALETKLIGLLTPPMNRSFNRPIQYRKIIYQDPTDPSVRLSGRVREDEPEESWKERADQYIKKHRPVWKEKDMRKRADLILSLREPRKEYERDKWELDYRLFKKMNPGFEIYG